MFTWRYLVSPISNDFDKFRKHGSGQSPVSPKYRAGLLSSPQYRRTRKEGNPARHFRGTRRIDA